MSLKKGFLLALFMSLVVTPLSAKAETLAGASGVLYSDVQTFYAAEELNVRTGPGLQYEVLTTLPMNSGIDVIEKGDIWSQVLYEGQAEYVCSQIISEEEIPYKSVEAPWTSGVKTYAGAITSSGGCICGKKTKQYKVLNMAAAGDYGILQYEGRYAVAMGTGWGMKVGQYFDLILENGTMIPCFMCDAKADCHTDASNKITEANGCMSEFYVDSRYFDLSAKGYGDVSYCCDEWKSRVVEVRVYDINMLD